MCLFNFRQAVSSYLHIADCIPQLHSLDTNARFSSNRGGCNTLQAVSRADVQLVRTLFDAAQKAH